MGESAFPLLARGLDFDGDPPVLAFPNDGSSCDRVSFPFSHLFAGVLARRSCKCRTLVFWRHPSFLSLSSSTHRSNSSTTFRAALDVSFISCVLVAPSCDACATPARALHVDVSGYVSKERTVSGADPPSEFLLSSREETPSGRQGGATLPRGPRFAVVIPSVAGTQRRTRITRSWILRRVRFTSRSCERRPNSCGSDGSARPREPSIERSRTALPFRFPFHRGPIGGGSGLFLF